MLMGTLLFIHCAIGSIATQQEALSAVQWPYPGKGLK